MNQMIDIFDKIEEKYGNIGWVLAVVLTVLCAMFLWIAIMLTLPIIGAAIPFLLLGALIYGALK